MAFPSLSFIPRTSGTSFSYLSGTLTGGLRSVRIDRRRDSAWEGRVPSSLHDSAVDSAVGGY